MTIKIDRRTAGLGLLALAAPRIARAADYPDHPIRLIVPFAAGGATDVVARLAASRMGAYLGQPIVVENRDGGGTLIGTRYVASQPADGYTLLMGTPTMVTNTLAYKRRGYKVEDFTPLGGIGQDLLVLDCSSQVPAKTLAELAAYGKANPGKLNIGSLGPGGGTSLMSSRFEDAAGLQAVDVVYKGGGPALQAVLSGEVQLFMDGLPTSLPYLKSDRMRQLAISSEKRSALAPDIPTFKEQGYPTIVGGIWFSMLAPAATPAAALAKLRAAAAAMAAEPDTRAQLTRIAVEPWEGSLADFQRFMEQDTARWAADVKRTGLVLD